MMDDLISRQDVLNLIPQDISDFEEGSCLAYDVGRLPSAQPELIKDTIQKFHDYQVEWLTSHCDLEFEPMQESWVVRFLKDTAESFMRENQSTSRTI